MHSSRVRTARLLTVSQHAVGVPAWGVYLPRGGCTRPGGCTCLGGGVTARGCTCLGVYLPWGVPALGCTCLGYLSRGCTWLGGIPAWGYLPGGVPAEGFTCPGWCTCPGGTCPCTPPLWTEWQTGAKILPSPKLRLRAVNINKKWSLVVTLRGNVTWRETCHFLLCIMLFLTLRKLYMLNMSNVYSCYTLQSIQRVQIMFSQSLRIPPKMQERPLYFHVSGRICYRN